MPDAVRTIADWIAAADDVVALTGAGISTDSGIPDFRGPQGVWTKNPGAERTATIEHYLSDPEVRRAMWRTRRSSPIWTAQPNAGHRALAELERAERLRALITQNIDGLHQAAGSSPGRVIEVHGTVHFTACLACGDRRPMEETLLRVDAGEEDPPCLVCGGILKSATISFGQNLDPDVLQRAFDEAANADVMLSIGSTLTVHPAAGLAPLAKRVGARLVIVNASETPYDDIADVVVRDPIGDVLPAIAAAVTSGRGG